MLWISLGDGEEGLDSSEEFRDAGKTAERSGRRRGVQRKSLARTLRGRPYA
jgi:hypothetical protein